MIKNKLNLILDFVTNEITKKDFEKKFPEVLDERFYEREYEKAIMNKDAVAIQYLSMFSGIYISDDFLYNISKKLIIECWHFEHENLALLFQFYFKNPDCIDTVVKSMYLDCNNWDTENYREPFIRKCSYVLGDLNTKYSIEKLKELSLSKDKIIREHCIFQLKRLNYEVSE